MAGIDSSIYFQQQPLDIMGNIQRGLSMRDMLDKRSKEKGMDEAYKAGMVMGPDGKVSFDPTKTAGALAEKGYGREAYEFNNDIQAKQVTQQKAQREQMAQNADAIARYGSAALQNPTAWPSIRAEIIKNGYATENDIPTVFDEGFVKNRVGMALSMTERYNREKDDRNFDLEKEKVAIQRLEAGNKREDRALARSEKARKDQELSATQAKQFGLYNSGMKAEQQYQEAIKNKKEYDPTMPGQWIDNSGWAPAWMKNNKANEAQSAQSAWVEAYLRDASGAAIPPSERGAYATDYFPQPGDTPQVVANKAELRRQKAENSLVGAGPQGAQMAQRQSAPRQELDVASYAQKHGISYEQAMAVKQQRSSKQAGL